MTSTTFDSCLQWPSVTFEIGDTAAPYTVNAVLNSVLAVVATASNMLVFSAIRKSTSLHLPSKLLLYSLVLTDLGVGLVGQPLFVTFLVAKTKRLTSIICFSLNAASVVGASLASSSLLTMTIMSLDRFIAFHLHIRYRQIVTVKRVCVALVSAWLASGFVASTWLWDRNIFYHVAVISAGICVLITSMAYVTIYRGLRRQNGHRVKPEVREQNPRHSRSSTLELSKYRKAASTMFWVYCIFLLCYVPIVCIMAWIKVTGINLLKRNLFEISQTILLLNSSLNPYVYCWRIPDIRAGVLQTVREICGQTEQQ